MKTKLAVFMTLLASAGVMLAATNDLTTLVQKGLLEEEANHNLEAAVDLYQSAIQLRDKDRQLAATAVFRLGECYRKLGKTNEANAQYERVLKEFPDQTRLAEMSRNYVGNQGTVPTRPVPPSGHPVPLDANEQAEIQRLKTLIQNSPDLINAPISRGYTPLQSECDLGRLTVVKFLIENGADIEAHADASNPPLCMAANSGNIAVIEYLLSKGANVNAPGNYGRTALHYAAQNGFKSVAEVLLAHKADPNAKNNDGETPLHIAASKGFKAVMEVLIANHAMIDARSKDDSTPLHKATGNNRAEAVRLLLSNKADVNAKDQGGDTPLMIAVKNGSFDMAKLLLLNGADVEAQNKSKVRALSYAVSNNNFEMAELLLNNHANPDVTGPSPLLTALDSDGKRNKILELLLSHGADPNQKYESKSLLQWAVEIGNKEAVQMLLDHQADIRTASLATAASKSQAMVELLLKYGADPNQKQQNGWTALHAAASKGDTNVMELLLQNGADIDARDDQGRSASDVARGFQVATPSGPSLRIAPPGSLPNEAAKFLSERGANQKIDASPDTIRVWRKGFPMSVVARRDSNGWNHFTLLQTIYRHYGFAGVKFPCPDFSQVQIYRNGQPFKTINLLNSTNSFDCAKDTMLEFGDVVELKEREHTLSDKEDWTDLQRNSLWNCLAGKASFIVRGNRHEFDLSPYSSLGSFLLSDSLKKILLSSSDLTRIKVTRIDPKTTKEITFVFDSTKNGGDNDLYLRNGDVIEIPDREEAK